jgi:predicted CoA-binding protein
MPRFQQIVRVFRRSSAAYTIAEISRDAHAEMLWSNEKLNEAETNEDPPWRLSEAKPVADQPVRARQPAGDKARLRSVN